MDLACTPKKLIGLIGSMQFAGWALSATFLPRLADLYGRRKVYLYSMMVHLVIYIAIVLSNNLTLTIVLMFCLGMTSVARASIGYLYTMEMLPLDKQAKSGTIMQVFDSLSGVVITLYFYAISKYWLWLQLWGLFLNLVTICGSAFIFPESPKYLHSNGKFKELRSSLSRIAKINRVK